MNESHTKEKKRATRVRRVGRDPLPSFQSPNNRDTEHQTTKAIMSAQFFPCTEDAHYFRDLLFH
jgi:hypothetical protein